MGLSTTHLLLVLVVVVLLFGRGKISDLMGDVAKGIKSFKKGMADDDTAEGSSMGKPKAIDHTGRTPERSESDRTKTG